MAHPRVVTPDRMIPNGFFGALVSAYSSHHHLVLKPDDVWIAIMLGFDALMNRGMPGKKGIAEALRSKLVQHEGQLELRASGGGTIRSFDMDDMVAQLIKGIETHTVEGVAAWAEPSFTTTTALDRLVGRMTLMSSLQSFFSYTMHLRCSLPAVTLLGTQGDWSALRAKADMLVRLGHPALVEWHARLVPVLDKLVQTAAGEPDGDWWQRIVSHAGGGSGPRYWTGWANVFAPCDTTFTPYYPEGRGAEVACGEFGKLDTNDVPCGFASVPVKVDDNGTEYQTMLHAGFFGVESAGDAVRPQMGWRLVSKD